MTTLPLTTLIVKANLTKGTLIIRLNRPNTKNALDETLLAELRQTLTTAKEDPAIRVVAFASTCDFFSSGIDFSAFSDDANRHQRIETLTEELRALVDAIIDFPKVLIALVAGPAVGTAVTLLALFDVVYASETASFSTPFAALTLTPDACSTFTFPRCSESYNELSLFCKMCSS